MSVDKGLFNPRQTDTYDFYEGKPAPWNSEEEIERLVPTHCCYCGVQCGMYLKVAKGKVVGVEPRYDFPLNHGMLCPKGTTAYQTVNHPDRLTYPLMRRNGKNSPLERASWDEALDTIARRFREIQGQHGADAVAVYSGSSMTNEKCYLMGKFARVGLGTRHCDYNGRLCMSSATGANDRSLGIDRAANPISDMLHSDVIFVIGANVGECFPIVTSYLWQARDRGAKLIVADPRQTPIARTADVFLPLRSGTDSALLNSMLYVLITENLVDEDFIGARTNGWEETKAEALKYPPERAAKVCGLKPETIIEAARLYGQANAAMIYTARGLEHQSKGVDNGVACANLALATGNFGRPGAGYMTLTGQGNGQGGREMGQKASQLPGEREIEDPEDREYIASIWGIEEVDLPHAGYPATLMIPAMEREEIRACLMICSNPMVSLPDQHTVERALRGLDLFVVIDFFLSETCELADIVLPGNVWAEDEGTTTSLEGRVIKYNQAVEPPGEARRDWEIIGDLAKRLGKGQYFPYTSARDIFDEMRLATKGAKADYFGITYEKIEEQNGVFWPCPTPESTGTPRLYEERFGFPDGKARFHPIPYIPPAEEPDEEYPLVLTTGRVIYHYLSGNQTRRTPFLLEQAPCPWVELHTTMAQKLGINDGDWVTVRTRRGEMTVPALVVRSIRPDTLFIPYHYGHTQAANILTNPVLEPMNKIPEYKVCAASAVRAERAPDWAKDLDPELLKQARRSRKTLPSAGANVGPRVPGVPGA
ncbi:MAG: Assimilatory nitrate reductase large subunit [Ktedonobacterales bacterium]|jgi:assimilatory nitrate reductase catalytic subunit|nr:MAG: Assimilatory nitrate reductase large subunit [Ktedonobacterales bacterium]